LEKVTTLIGAKKSPGGGWDGDRMWDYFI